MIGGSGPSHGSYGFIVAGGWRVQPLGFGALLLGSFANQGRKSGQWNVGVDLRCWVVIEWGLFSSLMVMEGLNCSAFERGFVAFLLFLLLLVMVSALAAKL